MLKINNLDVSIGSTKILHSINLSVEDFVGIIGRNGAGKTTLVKTIMGILPYKNGSIKYHDYLLTQKDHYKRTSMGIGYMPEDRRLVPSLTVIENILIPFWSLFSKGDAKRIKWILEYIPEVNELKNRRASTLSGGQQKLVALARALVTGDKLLLLDEPFEGVAPALADRILDLINNLKNQNILAIITESDESQSLKIVNKIYNLERGEISIAK